MEETKDKRGNECVFELTDTYSLGVVSDVARFKDIVAGLSRQTVRKYEELARVADERDKLLAANQRFRELSAWSKPEQESAKIGTALLFNIPVRDNPDANAYDPKFREQMQEPQGLMAVDLTDLDVSRFPLWKIIREIIRQVTEIRVYELEAHLRGFGVKTTRSAIESALLTHRKEFRIEKRGREKFVSLKGA